MKVGSDESNCHDQYHNGIEGSKSGIANPQDRHNGANSGGMTRGERFKSLSAMEWIESENTVLDEGRIVSNPGFRPSSSEQEFELVFGSLGNDDAQATDEGNRLMVRHDTIVCNVSIRCGFPGTTIDSYGTIAHTDAG